MTEQHQERFEVAAGHILLERDGELAILDTGSPFTLDAPEIVSRYVGRPVTRIVGCDAMIDWTLTVDWTAGQLTWAPSTTAPAGAVPFGESQFGVPVFEITSPAGRVQAVFDTGAPLSYVPPDLVAPMAPIAHRTDFLPGFGEFETDVYLVPITIGTHSFDLECGVLPELLQMMLRLICPDGYIVGSQIMRDRTTRFDVEAGWLWLGKSV